MSFPFATPPAPTSAATANRIILRDASGRAQVVAPSVAADIALKSTVTTDISTHNAVTNPHSATDVATASRIILRDAAGRAQVVDPSVAADIATKNYADSITMPAWIKGVQQGSSLSLASYGNAVISSFSPLGIVLWSGTATTLNRVFFTDSTGTWAVGASSLTIAGAGIGAIAVMSYSRTDANINLAFIDITLESLRMYRFTTAWTLLGSGLSIPGLTGPALARLNATDVAFIDKGSPTLRTYRWDGSLWSQIGNGLSISGIGNPALTAINGTDVAFLDSTLDSLRVYRFNGTDWSQLGSLSIFCLGYPTITAINSTDVAVLCETAGEIVIYRFNGSTWTYVRRVLVLGTGGYDSITAMSGTSFAVTSGAGSVLLDVDLHFSMGVAYNPSFNTF